MMTVKFGYSNGGEKIHEAKHVNSSTDGTIYIEDGSGYTYGAQLSRGDVLYVMNEKGGTIATYHGL